MFTWRFISKYTIFKRNSARYLVELRTNFSATPRAMVRRIWTMQGQPRILVASWDFMMISWWFHGIFAGDFATDLTNKHWLVVTGTWLDYDFPYIGNGTIVPTDELIFFSFFTEHDDILMGITLWLFNIANWNMVHKMVMFHSYVKYC